MRANSEQARFSRDVIAGAARALAGDNGPARASVRELEEVGRPGWIVGEEMAQVRLAVRLRRGVLEMGNEHEWTGVGEASAAASALSKLRRLHENPRIGVENDVPGRRIGGNLEALFRLGQFDFLDSSDSAAVRPDSQLEWETVRLTGLRLTEFDGDLFRGRIERP